MTLPKGPSSLAVHNPPGLTVPSLPGTQSVETLANGLRVLIVKNPQAPVVTTAVFFSAGTQDDKPLKGGSAHFLEHMMFKGSANYGPGVVDELTQKLGGSNNAFTSHDVTAYYFQFSREQWRCGLEIELDRWRGLSFEEGDFESERQVILEEISMYDNDPWSALDQQVAGQLFGSQAYGRPVLGTSDELLAMKPEDLRDFQRNHYCPSRAVLVIAGDVPEDRFEIVSKFAEIPRTGTTRLNWGKTAELSELIRIGRRQGSVPRMELAFRVPGGRHEDYPALRLLVSVLTWGRLSRLQSELVETGRTATWLVGELQENENLNSVTFALEPKEGLSEAEVEETLFRELGRVRTETLTPEEILRSKRLVLADWVFGHERIHQQALTAGISELLFGSGYAEWSLREVLACDADRLMEVARRWLDPSQGSVVAWSRPMAEKATDFE